jgi:hypothetical protein
MYTGSYYTVLVIFSIAVYFIVTDENAARLVNVRFLELMIGIRRRWMILTMWPRIKYDQWKIKRFIKKYRKEQNLPGD